MHGSILQIILALSFLNNYRILCVVLSKGGRLQEFQFKKQIPLVTNLLVVVPLPFDHTIPCLLHGTYCICSNAYFEEKEGIILHNINLIKAGM